MKMKEQRRMKQKLTVLACVGLALLLSTGFAFAQNTITVESMDVARCATVTVAVTLDNLDNDVAGMNRVTKPKDWRDVWRWQVGIEYGITKWCDLRIGYVYDNGPIPRHTIDYLVPSNDRQLYCFGTGFKWRSWTLDLSYTYLIGESRSNNARPASGVLKSRARKGVTHMVGFGIGYKF